MTDASKTPQDTPRPLGGETPGTPTRSAAPEDPRAPDEADASALDEAGAGENGRWDRAERAASRVQEPPALLVAIGASAGGLEALEALFDHLPDLDSIAYVVISHLSPDFKSVLDELLGRHTDMPVRVVEEGMLIRGGHIYVIPPGKEMIVAGQRLFLSDREADDRAPQPINVFLRALAREWGRRAVAVILSGSGSDGAQGCEKIRGVDGHVIVQAPETAAFESMPKAVLSSGLADEVLMPREIGDAIKARARMAADQFGADVKRESPETAQYRRIMQLIYGAEDLDFTGYKLTTFRRRISRRMSARDCTSLADYVSILTDDPEEIKRLSDDLLIGVTRFFRDPDAFDTLSSKALETLLRAKSETQEPLRIWVAGCATGEEAYSVAVQVAELRSTLDVEVAVQIFATDIRRDFLEHAGRGVYPASNMDGLPERLRNTYFQSLDGHAFQVDPVIRKLVIFAPHDLMRDPPFTKVDLITCRNVLIYFNADLQQRIMALFNFALSPSGFLLLGPSETLGELEQFFETIDPHWRLFRKARNRSLPYSMASDPIPSKRLSIQDTSLSAAHRTRGTAMLPAYLAMLKRYGPPCALITHDRQLVHAIGRARQYLRPPDGVVSLDILDMIDPGLRAPLATGIERCRREGQDIVFPNLALKEGGSNTPNVRLSIHPLFDKNGPDISHFVVIFDVLDADDQAEARSAIELEMGDAARERITSLEEDLKRTRESLQASIEEIETSNEELQSSNEELMAANEELQSTNEELSSVNQELHSVNAEYLRQNEKLTMLHNDMESLLRAVDVGVIFVDRDQVIRRFTSGAQRVFGLIAEDVGRRISDLRTQFREFDAAQIISQTLHSETPFEKEYQFEDGSWWLVRSAVVDAARHGAGVILAAFNIDRLKSAELEALENQRRYELVGTLTKAFTLTCAEDGTIIEPQAEWQAFTGQTFEEARGAGWVNAIHPGDRERIGALWHLSEQTPVKTPADADDEELRQTTYRLWHAGSGSWRHVQSRALKIRDKAGKTASWYRVILDAEEIVEAESLRRQRQAVLETVMSAATDEIYYIDTNEIIRHATDNGPAHGAVDPDGPLSREARLHIGQHVQNLIGADQYDAVKSHIQSVLSGEPIETRVTARKRGRSLDYIFVPHADEDGKVRGFAMAIRDLATVRALIDAENTQLEMMGRLIDRIDDEVILFTAQTQEITYANRRAQTNLRYPASQLSGRKITDLLPEFSAQRLAEIVQDPDAPRFSTFLLRYDGTTYDAQIAFGKEVHAGSEEIIGIMIGRDVTEQSAAASELRDRTADLAASNRDLEQFAMAISHDLKAPLRHITSFTGMLKKDIETTLNEGNREILTHIVDSATRMRTMIDSLLAYCRIQKHEQFTDVSLAEITHDAITNLSDVIASENPDLVGMDDLPIVLGDRSLLTMLMQNLIENALKYRGTETPVITFDAEKHQTGWRISIYDNGIGIDPAHGEDVFQVFRRLHPRDDSNSTGIGLAACRRIVDIHRGRIWLDPSYSPGACFRFELPAPAKRATPQRSVASSFR